MGVRGSSFAAAFDEALTRRDVSLGALHRRLVARATPVSLATLSYWRSGRREPEQQGSLVALAEIERILLLDPGALEKLLSPRRRRLAKPDLAKLSDRHQVINGLLAELGFDSPSDDLIDRELTLKYDLDEYGAPRRCTYILVVQALTDGADRRATVLRTEDPAAPLPTITPLGGYRLGRVLHDAETGFLVGEMLLDRELIAGETTMLEQQIDYHGVDPDDTKFFYWALHRMTSVSLWIRFHPDKVPERCEAYEILDGVEQVDEVDPVGASVSRTVTGFGPGTLGFRWQW